MAITEMAPLSLSNVTPGSRGLVEATSSHMHSTSRAPDYNIGKLLDAQRNLYADRVAIKSRWQHKKMTYSELHTITQHIALRLLKHGVRPGDHVVVLIGNSIEYTQLFLAVGAIGAIFSIINPTFTTNEVLDAVEFLDPAAIFVADRIGFRKHDDILSHLARTRACRTLVVRLGKITSVFSDTVQEWSEFIQTGPIDEGPRDLLMQYWAKPRPTETLCVQFTSGTTGPRKVAMLSHRNLIGNAWWVGNRLNFSKTDIVCCCAPLFHCFALVCGILCPMLYGASSIVPSDVFSASASLETLSEDKCTVIPAVATMFQAMLDHPGAVQHSPKICLRTGIVAGSTLSRALIERLKNEFNFTGLAYGYGLTEASCIVFLTDPSQTSLLDNHFSVGTLLPHSSARVVDVELKDLPPGNAGELILSGDLVFQGYYKNQQKTSETLIQDNQGRTWLRTGDLVTIDVDGRCVITGRVKDMIKRGGENIFPSDIETILEQHPSIEAAACIGIADDDWGEIVGVFIKRASNMNADKIGGREAKLWLRKKIAPHKMPEHFIFLGDGDGVPSEFPSNHTGKLLKGELRSIANDIVQRKRSS